MPRIYCRIVDIDQIFIDTVHADIRIAIIGRRRMRMAGYPEAARRNSRQNFPKLLRRLRRSCHRINILTIRAQSSHNWAMEKEQYRPVTMGRNLLLQPSKLLV